MARSSPLPAPPYAGIRHVPPVDGFPLATRDAVIALARAIARRPWRRYGWTKQALCTPGAGSPKTLWLHDIALVASRYA